MSVIPKDRVGKEITLGCTVLRAITLGKSPALDLCTVTRVEYDTIWLDNSPMAIRFNDRLVVTDIT